MCVSATITTGTNQLVSQVVLEKGQAENMSGAILPPAVLTGEAGGIWPAGMVSVWELISLGDYGKQDM